MHLGALDPDSVLLLAAAIHCLDDKLHKVTGLELLCILYLQTKQTAHCSNGPQQRPVSEYVKCQKERAFWSALDSTPRCMIAATFSMLLTASRT